MSENNNPGVDSDDNEVNEELENLLEEADLLHFPESAPSEIDTLRKEVADLKDALLRAAAETENLRKRSERDLQEAAKYASTSFARDIVGVTENLYRALDSIPEQLAEENPQLTNVRIGIDMVIKEFMSTLERQGIRRIFPIGEKFDHNLHQAVSQVDDGQSEAGTVLQVMQAGFTIHDRLLRPAMVVVATGSQQTQALDTEA